MIGTYRKLFSLFDQTERRRFWILTGVMLLVAAAEIAGISAVLMLLNVLAAPETIQSNRTLSWLMHLSGLESAFSFQIGLAVLVLFVVMAGLTVKALGTYATIRFSLMRGYSISSRLLAAYLSQPYAWFLDRNSAELEKNVLSEVDGLVDRVILPCLRLVANSLLVLAILGFLLMVDPLVTLFSGGVLGLGYGLIYLRFRGRLHRLGRVMMDAFENRFLVAQEATGGIKDVKLMGLEASYVRSYSTAARTAAQSGATMGAMSELPRFALEAITFGTMLALILLLLLKSGGNVTEIVPTLGVIAFSTMRLLPSLQQIYHALVALRGATAILDAIVTDFRSTPALPMADAVRTEPLRLERALELDGVSFAYAQAEKPTLRGVDLVIPARTTVGIVGGTGAGKTTLVDLILGLLTPDEGELRVDGVRITPENMRAWQGTLGYVPQTIFLTDETIASNIAFGVPKDQIDMGAVERAARIAALHDFVVSDLPQGYQTFVGERGVRLSGGQRQRIGIARALYRDPTLLIMDEATSALDNITERVVMEAVNRIRADKTIILIAHRLTTVKTCDTIFLMDRGRLLAQGSYDELLAGNATFRRMVAGDAEEVHAAL
ncbi:ABC transporter ATP-binding protein [Tabrizicola flagellatus]|uniref:ABC transporter ATP-binding protein n=1 Tax=Tabrizicola flagellatus TaxID=2593021 RepID=UPI00190FB5D6|nr:ABC transporter ATP-binding protein [Tabrizicola flagellatus]